MDRRIFCWMVLLLVASSCSSAPVSDSFTVSVGDSKSVQRGQAVLMPCWVSPAQNTENLEIRWYREENFDNAAMIYMPGKTVVSMEASFVGRVSFDRKDSASGGLETGDVTLKLTNVMIEDEGKYTCYVSSLQEHDSGSMDLYVTETGSHPVLSAVWREDNTVNVSCESEGWFPQPELLWSPDQNKNRVTFVKNSSGLIRVHSWIVVSASSEVSCSVGLPNTKGLAARLHLEMNVPSPPEDSGSSTGAWVAFTILLVIMMALLGFMFYWKKGKKPGEDQTDGKKSAECNEQNEPLLPKEASPPTDLLSASQNYVNIQLENTNPFLNIKDFFVRDKQGIPCPDGERVTCITAIKGTPGFTHGKHYWEVSLIHPNVPVKQSWWIGVTSSPEIPQREDFHPDATNGFWFLSSSPEDKDLLHFSTVPPVCLPVHSRPQKVGVYLDYEKGELSFYDVDRKRFIGSLTAEFKGQVFPLFNPGKGDKAPMTILQRAEQSQDVDPGPHREASSPKEAEGSVVEAADPLEHVQSVETSAAAPNERLQAPSGSDEGSTAVGTDLSKHLFGIKTSGPHREASPLEEAEGSVAEAADPSEHVQSVETSAAAPNEGLQAPSGSDEGSVAEAADPLEHVQSVETSAAAPNEGLQAPSGSDEGSTAVGTDLSKHPFGIKTSGPYREASPLKEAEGSVAEAADPLEYLQSVETSAAAPPEGLQAPSGSDEGSTAVGTDLSKHPFGIKTFGPYREASPQKEDESEDEDL